MTYRIAGIDVHKKMLAVVVADIAVDGAYEFIHRRVGTSPRELRRVGRVAGGGGGRGSGDGVDGAVLAAGVGGARTRLAARPPHAGRGESDGGHAALGASVVESGAPRAEAGLRGCRTPGEAVGGAGADAELCAGRRAAAVADGDAAQVSADAQPRPGPQPVRGPAGGSASEAVEPGLGSAGGQCTADAAGAGGQGHGSGGAGGAGRPAAARDPRAVARCARGGDGAQPRLSPAHWHGPRGRTLDRGADPAARSGDGRADPAAPGGRAAVGRSAGAGGRFGAADHRRGRGDGGDVSLAQATRLLGGARAPGRRRVRA